MSGVGDEKTVNNVTITFDDNALNFLSGDVIVAGTFKPTNYGSDEVLPPPAPSEPWGAELSVFNGMDPNGTWRLFVSNPYGGEGEIASWRLTFLVAEASANLSSSMTSIVRVGDHVVLRWVGTSAGRLQRSSSPMNSIWTDVPGSEGVNTIELPVGTNNEFFRLSAP